MTRSAHRAAALATSAVAGVVVLGLRAAPAAADCLAAAELSGDADIAYEVAVALASLGVVNGDVDGACPPVRAAVARDAAGVAVSVRDAHGRIEGRVVADARTAAAWIDSWVHADDAPLWAIPPSPPAAAAAPAPARVAAATPPSTSELAAAASPRPTRRWWRTTTVAVAAVRDLAPDGSHWDGVGGDACLRVGALCVGVAARHVRNGAYSDTGGLTAYDRSSTVVAATAALAIPIARVIVQPQAWAGAGVTWTRRHEASGPCLTPDPTDPAGNTPCGDTPLAIGDNFAARTIAPRLGGALGASVPLAGWLSLDARVGLEAAPGAHTARHVHDFAATPFDPATVPVAPGDPLLDLPGEPGRVWTVAVGVRGALP
ncbi:MAG: hypothetical protein H6709_12990 [Kofleriaceae bacterium]|nr:hypothetical protein [Kofleriaceae bacterium]MCB9572992.1 hypothetical protein [Kofleriaceae bacterium]